MCGRYAMTHFLKELLPRYDINSLPEGNWKPSYNIAPEQKAPIIIQNEAKKLAMATWGFVPSWAIEKKDFHPLINARSETAATSPAFRHAFHHSRCLIPFTHFFEWKKGKTKIPFAIALEKGGIGSFAGIFSEKEEKIRYAILTTSPSPALRNIHDRMPVILAKADEKKWLSPTDDPTKCQKLLRTFPGKLKAFPISKEVNNPRNDYPQILNPLSSLIKKWE
ncbi:MAG: SOS response-associated peptidase [Candidatus Diapherotrites archaeon]|nr:SOS response-associated peptidase [Candidatus Diapherotrites archaeon]